MIDLQNITATRLRIIFIISLVLIAILGVLFVTTVRKELEKYAEEVSRIRADSIASENSIQKLRNIQQELLKNKEAIERTNEIVADSQSYQYQDQIITDINDYAKRASIEVTNIDFQSGSAGSSTPATPTTPAQPGASTPPPLGVKSTSIGITLKNPVDYENLLRFVKSIEQNLTKMQISSVSFAKDSSGRVTSEALTIEVYIR